MKVTFLGTGTSHGVPMIGCDCATCRSDDPRDRRLRPAIYVEADGARLLVDAGPDLRSQALTHGIRRIDAVLFTHGHADHILGIDEIRRFNALQHNAPMPCYGDPLTLGEIRQVFGYVFDPATPKGGGVPNLELVAVDGPFTVAGQCVVPVPLLHGTRPILGYRFDRFAYLTDCSAIPPASWPLLEGVEIAVIDALRDRPHPTHFTVDEALGAARRIGARRAYFTHMCHDLPHAATCARLPEGVELAYDGLVVTLEG